VSGKRTAHERFHEVIAAAVRVFTQEGYRAARMSDVARAAGLSEAALYRYVESKEGLFVLAIRHALLLEAMPAEAADGTDEADRDGGTGGADGANGPGGVRFPLKPPPLAEMISDAREFVAAAVPFGSLAAALSGPVPADPAAEFETVMRELFTLEAQTREAADMIERSARELPELADLLNSGLRRPVLAAMTDYLARRASTGTLRATPDTAATARLVLETLTWFARHRYLDPYGAAIPDSLAADTAVDAMIHALVPAHFLGERP
jgi:AcrR family transcriptional regulator